MRGPRPPHIALSGKGKSGSLRGPGCAAKARAHPAIRQGRYRGTPRLNTTAARRAKHHVFAVVVVVVVIVFVVVVVVLVVVVVVVVVIVVVVGVVVIFVVVVVVVVVVVIVGLRDAATTDISRSVVVVNHLVSIRVTTYPYIYIYTHICFLSLWLQSQREECNEAPIHLPRYYEHGGVNKETKYTRRRARTKSREV